MSMDFKKMAVNVGPVERTLSTAGGAALAVHALLRGGKGRVSQFLWGAGLLARGVTGRCPVYQTVGKGVRERASDSKRGVKVSEMVTIHRSPDELYSFWRDFDNLPRVMRHLESVTAIDAERSRWKARGPGGQTVEWEAVVIRDMPGRLITWETVGGATVAHAGSVSFEQVPGGSGTELRVILRYDPPGGVLGAALASALGKDPGHQIQEDLRNFKRMVESGEILAPLAQARS